MDHGSNFLKTLLTVYIHLNRNKKRLACKPSYMISKYDEQCNKFRHHYGVQIDRHAKNLPNQIKANWKHKFLLLTINPNHKANSIIEIPIKYFIWALKSN